MSIMCPDLNIIKKIGGNLLLVFINPRNNGKYFLTYSLFNNVCRKLKILMNFLLINGLIIFYQPSFFVLLNLLQDKS